MKILQTPPGYYPLIGGVAESCRGLSRELVRMGHQVRVLSPRAEKSKREESLEGVQVRRLWAPVRVSNTHITPGLPFALLKEEFDVIHTHLPTPWSADWSALIAALKGRPLVLTYHNDIVGSGIGGILARLYNLSLLTVTLMLAKRIITTSKGYASLSPHLRPYRNKTITIPWGVDTDRFRPLPVAKEANTLFFLSILDEYHRYKGLDYLLRAMPLVKERIKDVKLIVGGRDTLTDDYRRLASELGISDAVRLEGFIPEDRLVEYYNRCSAFVLPSVDSRQEGFGIVLLEAMACGSPVITTTAAGLAEDIQDAGAGIVVQPKQVEPLTEAIVELISNQDLHRQASEKGLELVRENYDWKAVAKQTAKVYADVSDQSGNVSPNLMVETSDRSRANSGEPKC